LLIQNIAIIRAKPNGTQIRVGFIGQTGAGKTTIMNSLLLENILPRSEEGSCTAVVVEVSWNDYDDPNLRYRAEISGISSEEFREELLRLYQDKKAWDSPPDGEDNDPDLELKQRMDYTLSKISCLFPEINNLKDLEKFSVDSLLNRDCCRRLLGKTILRSCGTQDEFYGCIRPFIDTSKSKNGAGVEASLWPLVKVVKLRIKSEILRNGLILVDLPGSGDTSAARCKVAENYRKNLTVACVVAPAQRAASDKNAHDLLSSLARTNMQLDGIFNSDSLFFVVSQIDRLEEVPEYIRDHPNLAESLSDDFSRATDKAKQIEKLDMDLKQTLRDLEINEKQMQRLEAKNREIERRIEKLSNSTHTGRKRKHDESHGGEGKTIPVWFNMAELTGF
jgi:predicted GTPase